MRPQWQMNRINNDDPAPIVRHREETGTGQSLSGQGGIPTTSFIENILKNHNAKYTKHITSELNGNFQVYDWPDGSGPRRFSAHNRRFWTVDCSEVKLLCTN
jgi:hypothetical protein